MDNHTKHTNIFLERYIYFEKDSIHPFGQILKKILPESKQFHSIERRPLMLVCETVNICNNDCIICAHSLMKRKKETMPLDLFEKVLKDYSDMGGGKLSMTPKIGDIFLDKLLIERLKIIPKYSKISGLSVTTNAIASSDLSETELQFVLHCFERFHISIYGLDAEEYRVMTRRSHYLKMLKNVKRIIDLSKNNKNIVFGFRFLKSHTEDEIKIWIQQNFGCQIPFSFTNSYSNWGNMIDTKSKLPFNGEWIPIKENTVPCLVPLFACQIYSNGDVSFCACPDFDINRELRLGNIKEKHLIDIYNSNKCKELWNFNNKMPNYCKYCTFHKPFFDIEECSKMIENPIDFIGG